MNQTFKKFAAAATLAVLSMSAVPAPAAAAETALIASQENVYTDEAGTVYVPVRDAMKLFGVDIEWEQNDKTKLVLSAGGQTYQAMVDSVNGVVSTKAGDFVYENNNGSIALPVSFYETVLTNIWVWYDPETGILHEFLYDGDQPVGLHNLAVYGEEAQLQETATYYESGLATWYGPGVNGNYTASGEIFNMYDYTAAHKYLPFGTRVRVTNLNNGQSVIVRITDRGPFAPGRVIDLSLQAAGDIGLVSAGVAPVTLEILD
jgi:rare lipoprotein A (peptidoglycan hydrolase)